MEYYQKIIQGKKPENNLGSFLDLYIYPSNANMYNAFGIIYLPISQYIYTF